jgi:hypothetical protein
VLLVKPLLSLSGLHPRQKNLSSLDIIQTEHILKVRDGAEHIGHAILTKVIKELEILTHLSVIHISLPDEEEESEQRCSCYG